LHRDRGGVSLNDQYLEGLPLERDAEGFQIMTKGAGESSIPGLFVLGALRHGHSQAIIYAGQGAEAAIEISTRIVEILKASLLRGSLPLHCRLTLSAYPVNLSLTNLIES
jgi:hypothetical protein